ncbi:Signal recognition particle receptor subunit alpha -like protein [Halotydeus destructor]|nr:Signal recognition particle receptor subunit alpha -like protein [Halotydeus destructor]
MLDFFVIFTKSGLVLFTTVNQAFTASLNKLIRTVILEERTEQMQYETLALQYRLNNEFDLVFVVGYQKMLSLSYIDKFLDDVQLAFRDKYNDFDLRSVLLSAKATQRKALKGAKEKTIPNVIDFNTEYSKIYAKCHKAPTPQAEMRSFEQSSKSQKTVASMIVNPKEEKKPKPSEKKAEESIAQKILNGKTMKLAREKEQLKSPPKKGKQAREWDNGGKNVADFDYSKKGDQENKENTASINRNLAMVKENFGDSQMRESNLEMDVEDSSDEEEAEVAKPKSSFFGNIVKSLNYNKALTKEDLSPVLLQLRDHLIGKNVASEIATKLCDSVMTKLEGQQANTWLGLKGFVKNALEDSMLRILSPNRNVNILREIKARSPNPYVICFCGVNGVGKSTNLAKISNWLIMNGVKVLIIACDTFRAGAVEQLRTHVTALKNIHEKNGEKKVELFEKGYGKDSAAIAMEGVNYARQSGYNCCLIDTAGRMQDNEPLMKQLAKLIKINEPDLTLFVGEALVGNEAVDQLTKFNTALLDNGCKGTTENASAINGIVLTKFDTIDDQVGAAISMTYITGQPIVFVGVGQTYWDLKQLNAKAVVKALMK